MEQTQLQKGNIVYADQLNNLQNSLHSIAKMLSDIPTTLPNLRRVFRGESLYQSQTGEQTWVQTVKPTFVKIDFKTNLPLKEKVVMPWNSSDNKPEVKEVYVPNDEAIEEVLSMLSFMGINSISPITRLTEDIINDDLKEFEMKLAAVIALKQKEWGIDKELFGMYMTKIKTLIQDVRYMALQGKTLDAIQKTVQRTEQVIEQQKQSKFGGMNPYG